MQFRHFFNCSADCHQFQNATTEMLAWLQQRYGYTSAEANLLIGFAVEYEVGNMFDPAYTMICKIPKRLLPK